MPRVESSSGRLAIAADLVSRVETWAAEIGYPREEAAELALRATVPPHEPLALDMLSQLGSGDGMQTPAEISQTMVEAEIDVPMVAVRLPGRRAVQDSDEVPFAQSYVGADLHDDAVTVWGSARGPWRVSDRPRVLVAVRLGRPLGIYRVPGWEQIDDTARRWAPAGQIITPGGRLDATTGDLVGDATDSDRRIYDAVMGRLVLLPSAANPIIWLHGR